MMLKPSSIVLVLANLIPLAGVLWLNWSVLEILLVYWSESVIIGVINLLRMLSSRTKNPLAGFSLGRKNDVTSALFEVAGSHFSSRGVKAFIIPFFVIHYGAFCFGHFSAVVGIFAADGVRGGQFSLPVFSEQGFWFAVAAIAISHLFSFFHNFIGKQEHLRTGVAELMKRPYGRIVVMQITVIVGAGLSTWLGNPLPMLLVLVVVKTIIDLRYHLSERDRFSVSQQ